MKPRFSVLALGLLVGYIALILATIRAPASEWPIVATVACLVFMGYLIVLGFDRNNASKSQFGRVSIAVALLYLFVSFSPQGDTPWRILPHQRLLRFWYAARFESVNQQFPGGKSTENRNSAGRTRHQEIDSLNAVRRSTMEPLAILNCAAFFGVTMGTIALWRYRDRGSQITDGLRTGGGEGR